MRGTCLAPYSHASRSDGLQPNHMQAGHAISRVCPHLCQSLSVKFVAVAGENDSPAANTAQQAEDQHRQQQGGGAGVDDDTGHLRAAAVASSKSELDE